MNIVELHERVRFWLDLVGSARIESSDIDNAINIAMNDIVDEKYLPLRQLNSGEFFQKTQRVRDELSNIVKQSDSSNPGAITFTNYTGYSVIPAASLPADYKYLLAIATYSSTGTVYNCWPITYDRKNIVQDNPFRRVRMTPIVKQYYNESSEGIRITNNITPAAAKAVIDYLSVPVQWKYGLEYGAGHNFINGEVIIVTSESALYNGTTYLRGQEITIIAPFIQLTSGTALSGYTNSNINKSLHEVIGRKASVIYLMTIKEFDKAKAIVEYFI